MGPTVTRVQIWACGTRSLFAFARCAMVAHDAWFYSMHRLFHQVTAFCMHALAAMPRIQHAALSLGALTIHYDYK